ncbi:MAG: hypothetical protein IIB61_07355, partial [Planctomycetes bacterium]|nr:hypothetical protein [Planctomycetota bacterium]
MERTGSFGPLAGHAALAWGPEALRPGAHLNDRFPDAVKRVALAIEVLHKASLIHDD